MTLHCAFSWHRDFRGGIDPPLFGDLECYDLISGETYVAYLLGKGPDPCGKPCVPAPAAVCGNKLTQKEILDLLTQEAQEMGFYPDVEDE